jgi:hypothetical protein
VCVRVYVWVWVWVHPCGKVLTLLLAFVPPHIAALTCIYL